MGAWLPRASSGSGWTCGRGPTESGLSGLCSRFAVGIAEGFIGLGNMGHRLSDISGARSLEV